MAVEARCNQIAAQAKEMQDKLNVLLKTGLMRVPKKVKRMTVKDFVTEYGALPYVSLVATHGVDENALLQTAMKGASGSLLI